MTLIVSKISIHARRRFRSRYMRPDENREIGDRVADEWLWGLLQIAIREGYFEDVESEGRPLRVIELVPRKHGDEPVFACQREDGTVVSLLEKWQRDNNRMNVWRKPNGDKIGLGATLKERLVK